MACPLPLNVSPVRGEESSTLLPGLEITGPAPPGQLRPSLVGVGGPPWPVSGLVTGRRLATCIPASRSSRPAYLFLAPQVAAQPKVAGAYPPPLPTLSSPALPAPTLQHKLTRLIFEV